MQCGSAPPTVRYQGPERAQDADNNIPHGREVSHSLLRNFSDRVLMPSCGRFEQAHDHADAPCWAAALGLIKVPWRPEKRKVMIWDFRSK